MTLLVFDTAALDAKIAHFDSVIRRHDAEILAPPWLDQVLAAASRVASIELRLSQMEEDIDTFGRNLVTLGAGQMRTMPAGEADANAAGDSNRNIENGSAAERSGENAPVWEILSVQLSTLRKQMKQLQCTHSFEDLTANVDRKLGEFSIKLDRANARIDEVEGRTDGQHLSQQLANKIAEAKTQLLAEWQQHVSDSQAVFQEQIAKLESAIAACTNELGRQTTTLADVEQLQQRHEQAISQLQCEQEALAATSTAAATLCSQLKSSNFYRGLDKLASRLERTTDRQMRRSFAEWKSMVHRPSDVSVRSVRTLSVNGRVGGPAAGDLPPTLLTNLRSVSIADGVRILTKCAKRGPFFHWWRGGRIQSLLKRIVERKEARELGLLQGAFVRLQCLLFDSTSRGQSQLFTDALLRICGDCPRPAAIQSNHFARLIAAFLVGARRAVEKLQETDLATVAEMDARLKGHTHGIMLVIDQNRTEGIQALKEACRCLRDELALTFNQADDRLNDLDSRHSQLAGNVDNLSLSLSQSSTTVAETSSELTRQMALIGKLSVRLDEYSARLSEADGRLVNAGQRIEGVESTLRDLAAQLDASVAKHEDQWTALDRAWQQIRVNVVGVVQSQEKSDEQLKSLQQALNTLQAAAASSQSALHSRIDNLGFEMPPLDAVVEAALYLESQAMLTSKVERMSEEMSDQVARWALRAAGYIAGTADLRAVARIAQGAHDYLGEDKAVQRARERLFRELDEQLCKAIEAARPNAGSTRAEARARFRGYLLEAVDAALSKHEQSYVTDSTRMANMLTNNPKCLACDRPLRLRVRPEGAQYCTAVDHNGGATSTAPPSPSRTGERPHTAPSKRSRLRPSSASTNRAHSQSTS